MLSIFLKIIHTVQLLNSSYSSLGEVSQVEIVVLGDEIELLEPLGEIVGELEAGPAQLRHLEHGLESLQGQGVHGHHLYIVHHQDRLQPCTLSSCTGCIHQT
jgi:hypothetical protein